MIDKMLFLTYGELADKNVSEGFQVLFQFIAEELPFFFPLVLFGFFAIIFLGSFFSQQRQGQNSFIESFAVAGFVTFIISVLFQILQLIPTYVEIICLLVTIVGAVLLLNPTRD